MKKMTQNHGDERVTYAYWYMYEGDGKETFGLFEIRIPRVEQLSE